MHVQVLALNLPQHELTRSLFTMYPSPCFLFCLNAVHTHFLMFCNNLVLFISIFLSAIISWAMSREERGSEACLSVLRIILRHFTTACPIACGSEPLWFDRLNVIIFVKQQNGGVQVVQVGQHLP